MALLVAEMAFDAYEVSLRDKPPEMLVLSPKGSVPVHQLSSRSMKCFLLDVRRFPQ
jgi:glutathione S-transferase